jgi:hypothetical protein
MLNVRRYRPFASYFIHKVHFYPAQRSFSLLSKLTSICIHIFIVEELSYNPLSWPREKHPRQALRFQDKFLIMLRILHLGALIPCEPGHTSQRFSCGELFRGFS